MISLKINFPFFLLFFTGFHLLFFPSPCLAEIRLANGQLTVQVKEMPLASILQEISKQGNIEIQGGETLGAERMTIKFGPLPLEKGLRRILHKTNYMTTFDQNGNILRLTISNKPQTPASGNIHPFVKPPTSSSTEQLKSLDSNVRESNDQQIENTRQKQNIKKKDINPHPINTPTKEDI